MTTACQLCGMTTGVICSRCEVTGEDVWICSDALGCLERARGPEGRAYQQFLAAYRAGRTARRRAVADHVDAALLGLLDAIEDLDAKAAAIDPHSPLGLAVVRVYLAGRRVERAAGRAGGWTSPEARGPYSECTEIMRRLPISVSAVLALRPCSDAADWLRAQSGSPAEIWRACERGDWMLWLLSHTSGGAPDSVERLHACAQECEDARQTARARAGGCADVCSANGVRDIALRRCAEIVRRHYHEPPGGEHDVYVR